MYHLGTVKGSAIRAVSLLTVTAAALLGIGGIGGIGGIAGATAAASGPAPVQYTCSMAAYGQSLPTLNLAAALFTQSNGSSVTVKLAIQPVQLPAAAAAALPSLTYLDAAASAPATGMSGTAVSLAGQSAYQKAGGTTQLPAVTATGTMPAASQAAGSDPASVQVPRTLTLTPVNTTARAPLTCTTSSVTSIQAAVTATGTNAATGTTGATGTGQGYTCTITVGTSSTTTRVPMRMTVTKANAVGTQGAVTLSAPVSALGSAFPSAATPMSVAGAAMLGGMQEGSVPITGLSDAGTGTLRLTGHWMPEAPGAVRIFAPHRFAARLRAQTATMVTVSCAAMSATTTSTQVMVRASTTAAASASAAAGSPPGAAPGAPDTGGGGSLHPANELPLAAGGAAAMVAGLATTGYALRRRRGLTR